MVDIRDLFGLYDINEGFRSLETEKKVQENMKPVYRKIYLGIGYYIKVLMAVVLVLVFLYYILNDDTALNGLIVGSLLMVFLSIVKQIMRKIIRNKHNI